MICIGHLPSDFHGQAAVKVVPLHFLSLALLAEVRHRPVAFINSPRPPRVDVNNPVIKVAVHVQVNAPHVELQWRVVLQTAPKCVKKMVQEAG